MRYLAALAFLFLAGCVTGAPPFGPVNEPTGGAAEEAAQDIGRHHAVGGIGVISREDG